MLVSVADLRERAARIVREVENADLSCSILETEAQVGSGASPAERMTSIGIGISHSKMGASKIASCLRSNFPAIMGRIAEKVFYIDMKAVRASEDDSIIQALNKL